MLSQLEKQNHEVEIKKVKLSFQTLLLKLQVQRLFTSKGTPYF